MSHAVNGRSLDKRLSIWLAMQGFSALALVSLIVYAATWWSHSSRQDDELKEKREAVRYALLKAKPDSRLPEFILRLDDFVAGHADLSLTLAAGPGQTIYSTPHGIFAGASRRADFQMPWSLSPTGLVLVELALDTGADDRLLRRLAITLVIAVIAGTTAVAISGFWLVRRGLDPVRSLSNQLQTMAPDKADLRLDGSNQPSELQPVVEQFNALLARVERAYMQLEGFNADVAHELRTPLTTLIGASELALHRDRSAAELQEVIASNLEELRRLSRIVDDMMFLSRADRGAIARRSPVRSLVETIREVVDYHDAALNEAGVIVGLQGDAAGSFDAALLRRAMSNLLGNATRYATKGSTILVSIQPQAEARVRLSASNVGPTIPAAHLPRLFDRFYRGEASRQRSEMNHGLGLAIVAAVARMHGGLPFAESANGRTTVGMEIAAGMVSTHQPHARPAQSIAPVADRHVGANGLGGPS